MDGSEFGLDAWHVGASLQGRVVHVEGGVHVHSAGRERVTPRQLVAPTAFFTDRDEVMAGLDAAWERAKRAGTALVVVFSGPGGIGKTELAAKWLQRIAGRVDGPHLFADMAEGGVRTAADVLGGFLRALGEDPAGVPAQGGEMSGLFRTLTSDRPAIVFLDNVRLAAQVRPLIPNSAGSVVAVTARSLPQGLAGVVHAEVKPLDDSSAVRLLGEVAGLVDVDSGEIDAVVEVCGGNPLSLYSVGQQMASRLGAGSAVVGESVADGRLVAVLFDSGYDALPEQPARLYRRLSVLFGRVFTVEMATVVSGIARPEDALEQLVGAGLLHEVGNGRYRFHDLALEHARAKAGEGERGEALRLLVQWYLSRSAAADFALMPGRWRLGPAFASFDPARPPMEEAAARAWLEESRAGLRAAVTAAADQGWYDLVVQLVEAQWALSFLLKFHEHWIDVHQIGVAAAERASDPRFAGRMYCQLGFGYLELGRVDAAEEAFRSALAADRAAGHARGEMTALESVGLLMLVRSGAEELPDLVTSHMDFAREALTQLAENLRLNLAVPGQQRDDRAVALAWRHLGRALSAVGDHEEANARLTRAAREFSSLADAFNAGKAQVDLAQACIRAGRHSAALEVGAEAVRLLGAAEHPVERAVALETMSVAYRRAGELGQARRCLAEAAVLLADRNHPRAQAVGRQLSSL